MNSPKNQITTLLLAFFLGSFGIHRFYVGKLFTGVLMLLTLGGLGIWWLIDIIFIITGEFPDANGLKIYSKNFRLARYIKPAGIFLIVFSVILLIGTGFAFWSSKSFVNQAVNAKGKVIDLRESVSDGNTYYYPTYTFEDSTGVKHTIQSTSGSNPPSYSVGETIEVLYIQNKPKKSKINSFFSLWGLPTILSVLGGIDLIFGILLIMLGRYVNKEKGEPIA